MFYWLIATYKLLKAVALLGTGVFCLYLARTGVADGVGRALVWLRVNPADQFVHAGASWVAQLDGRQLEVIGVAILLYGLFYVAQTVGLMLRRRWGSYLVIVNTGIFIPLEIYEVVRTCALSRLAVLAINVAIVLYLVERLRHSPQRYAGRVGGAAPLPS